MSWDLAKHTAPASALSWAFLGLGLALFTMAGFGWTGHLSSAGEVVAANVTYAGERVEGMDRSRVEELVTARARRLEQTRLTLRFGPGEDSVTLADLGLEYHVEETVDAVLSTRYQGSVWDQFTAWVSSGLRPMPSPELWSLHPERTRAVAAGLVLRPVAEPRVEVGASGVRFVPGVVGVTADGHDLVASLSELDLTDPPPALEVETLELPPTVGDREVEALAARLDEVTAAGVELAVRGRRAVLPAHKLRSALVVEVGDGETSAWFDEARLQEAVESVFIGSMGEFVDPVVEVRGAGGEEEIVVVAVGEAPPVCCDHIAGWLGARILAGARGPFGLPTRPDDDPLLEAWADGSLIVEKVGEFTTPHPCCEARVQNIQRMADMVRGIYLLPGERLSLNEFIGPRTRDNGFVAAGAIRQGHLIPEVGGGVSQFATTIFNAAYFAGLDFEEYRSHSLYFSRYPYGREATISSPAPDLVMVNTTLYPVLIWTSYTDTSVTVSMYSTRHIVVSELGQRTSRRGACTHVETDRQRVYPDGRTVVDTIVADYRPAEGIDCNGNPIPEPEL